MTIRTSRRTPWWRTGRGTFWFIRIGNEEGPSKESNARVKEWRHSVLSGVWQNYAEMEEDMGGRLQERLRWWPGAALNRAP